ncbi:MAG TPA: DUF5681 domain-containing protein [Rhizomicrobium sp.]|nr:DUF5681 domain-containing protein [Rhizomicrobium sp.]
MHTRFRKGQSGNPGGKSATEKLLKHDFDVALANALNANEDAVRETRPAKVIELIARQIALHAVDGRPSAQRLVVSILERDAREAAIAQASEAGEPRPVAPSGMDEFRQMLGDRYDEFEKRYDKAIGAGSLDDLLRLADEFADVKFPQ